MPQSPQHATAIDISSQGELIQVVINNPREADECILFPENATDGELQSKWILAKEGSYIPPTDTQ